jgi:ribulose-phosphate 3-epimerase
MSINPGFGGQKFIEQTYEKISKLKAIIDDAGASTIIEVDGGVNTANAGALIEAGAKALVAGSFVFKSEDPLQTITDLKNS